MTRPQATAPTAVTGQEDDHERVCHHCAKGDCARCNTPHCTCCYGNEDP